VAGNNSPASGKRPLAIPVKADRTPAKFATFVQAEIARWSSILKAANAEVK